ncbi:hypothetical protein EV401DRAFT_2202383 [Pisolithus croceorrhizus]|nr:hypothetical protein EV401DRAFT_2202383 [Pisolithus croceorrhizus]
MSGSTDLFRQLLCPKSIHFAWIFRRNIKPKNVLLTPSDHVPTTRFGLPEVRYRLGDQNGIGRSGHLGDWLEFDSGLMFGKRSRGTVPTTPKKNAHHGRKTSPELTPHPDRNGRRRREYRSDDLNLGKSAVLRDLGEIPSVSLEYFKSAALPPFRQRIDVTKLKESPQPVPKKSGKHEDEAFKSLSKVFDAVVCEASKAAGTPAKLRFTSRPLEAPISERTNSTCPSAYLLLAGKKGADVPEGKKAHTSEGMSDSWGDIAVLFEFKKGTEIADGKDYAEVIRLGIKIVQLQPTFVTHMVVETAVKLQKLQAWVVICTSRPTMTLHSKIVAMPKDDLKKILSLDQSNYRSEVELQGRSSPSKEFLAPGTVRKPSTSACQPSGEPASERVIYFRRSPKFTCDRYLGWIRLCREYILG